MSGQAEDRPAIGGYLQFELRYEGTELHADALRYQSSRAALLALLQARRPTAVWLPWYICESAIEPLHATGVAIKRYSIDRDFYVQAADVAADEWLLYVNYFGLCDSQVDDVLRRFPPERVLIDNAQALFAMPRDCLANLYSPRKFVGVPDGGYLIGRAALSEPTQIDTGSLDRSAHLLKRLAFDAETGYADYAAAEQSLSGQEPQRMSALTRHMLGGIDYESVQRRRRANYDLLHTRLRAYNPSALARHPDSVPLCYPLFRAPEGLRESLFGERIYTPGYWPEVGTNDSAPPLERELAKRTLFIPCDQRLAPDQIEQMAGFLAAKLAERDSPGERTRPAHA